MAGLGHRQDRGVMLPPLDEIDASAVPAAGKGAIRQTEVSGGIPHWQHVRNAGIRLED